jgi:predicted HD phosphohydrolase
LCVPLVRQGKSIGAIEAVNKQGGELFGQADLDLLRSIADSAALSIENARLYAELAAIYDSTLDALTAALDLRDSETEGHSRRVVEYTARLARQMSLPEQEVRSICRGALIHDIGDLLAPYNHAQLAAAIIRPYVREQVTWIVEQHELFQTYYYVHHMGGDRYARERLREHRWYESCVNFCERYDQSSFDPAYRTMSLAEFEPLLRQVFSRIPHDPHHTAPA